MPEKVGRYILVQEREYNQETDMQQEEIKPERDGQEPDGGSLE